jgi:hypothetical protein
VWSLPWQNAPSSALEVRFSFFHQKPAEWLHNHLFSKVLICVTTHGPASITVHGTFFPEASNMLVIPIFFPINPDIFLSFLCYAIANLPYYTLISTSTPLGSSSFINASTVFDDEE